jgi:hypothetical protein
MRVPTAEKSIPFSHMRNANLSRLVNLLKCKHRHLRFFLLFFPLVKSNSLLLCCICGVSSIEEHECMKPLLRMAECTCQSPEKKVRNTVSQMRKASRKKFRMLFKVTSRACHLSAFVFPPGLPHIFRSSTFAGAVQPAVPSPHVCIVTLNTSLPDKLVSPAADASLGPFSAQLVGCCYLNGSIAGALKQLVPSVGPP